MENSFRGVIVIGVGWGVPLIIVGGAGQGCSRVGH